MGYGTPQQSVQSTVNRNSSMKLPESGLPDLLSFFDKIYCISLDVRGDRREQARKEFAKIGLLQHVEFVIVTKHSENREKGIFQSHMKCLTMGVEAGARHILVFEDDIFFENFDGCELAEICNYLDSSTDWNALFLGCITSGSSRTGQKSLVKVKYRCLAHAYALNTSFVRQFVQNSWNGIPFDELLRRHSKEFFAIYPMCAFQGLSGSDNQTVVIEVTRRLLGGLPFIQKTNELYQNNKVVLLLFSSAVLLLVAFLALSLW